MSYGNHSIRWEFTPMQVARILSYGDSRATSSYINVSGPSVLCVGSTDTYSASASGVTDYSWDVPPGFSILSGDGTETVTVRNNSSTSGGVVEVAFEGCGAFGASKQVSGANSGFYIIGSTYVYSNYSSHTYSVSNAGEAGITYSWIPPSNAYVSGGTSGSSITLVFPPHFSGGSLSVKETSPCGTTSKSIYIQSNGSGSSGSGYRISSEQDSVYALDSTALSLDDTKSYSVYPNPSNGEIVVECLFDEDYTIQIYSLDNKLQKESHLNGGKRKMDVSHLPSGLYLLKIILSNKTVYSEKLIIK